MRLFRKPETISGIINLLQPVNRFAERLNYISPELTNSRDTDINKQLHSNDDARDQVQNILVKLNKNLSQAIDDLDYSDFNKFLDSVEVFSGSLLHSKQILEANDSSHKLNLQKLAVVFRWLDQSIKICSSELTDDSGTIADFWNIEEFLSIKEHAQQVLDKFKTFVVPCIERIQSALTDALVLEYSNPDISTIKEYTELNEIASKQPELLEGIGLDKEHIKKVKDILQPKYIQGDSLEDEKLKNCYQEISKAVNEQDYAAASRILIVSINKEREGIDRDAFRENLMRILSYELDFRGDTLVQRVVGAEKNNPTEAFRFLQTLKRLGLDFYAVNQRNENALHYLHPNESMQTTTLLIQDLNLNPNALNSSAKSPQDLFEARKSSLEQRGELNEYTYLLNQSIFHGANSIDGRPTLKTEK